MIKKKSVRFCVAMVLLFTTTFRVHTFASADSFIQEKNAEDFVSKSLESGVVNYYSMNRGNYSMNDEESVSGYSPEHVESASVFEPDDRSKVSDTSASPYNRIAYVKTEWPNGDISHGTAWLSGPDVAVTAGHLVYDIDSGGWAASVTIWPGRDDNTSPYGYARALSIHTSANWIKNGDKNFDYGVLELNKAIGDSIGYFGMYRTSASLDGKSIAVSGYPISKPQEQWYMSGSVASSNESRIHYNLDTEAGQSGSPIYWYDPTYEYVVIGIHTRGVDLEFNDNSGVRITESLFAWINSFRN